MQPTIKIVNCNNIALALLVFGIGSVLPVTSQSTVARNVLDECGTWTLGTANGCASFSSEMIPYRGYRRFFIPIPAGADYNLIVTVESSDGDVDAQLLLPNGTVLSTSSERIGHDVVTVSRSVLNRYPGNYTLIVQAVAPALGQTQAQFSIRLDASSEVTLLEQEDKQVLAAIAMQCCPEDDDALPDACTALLLATSANATAQDDLCQQPPNMCNSMGRLTKLFLAGGDRGNLVCSSFPQELGSLPALEVLDWTGNHQVGTLADVATVLAPLRRTLKRLYLGRNAFSGPLGCELVNGTNLEILRLERNLLSGTLPDCMFKSPTLRQLSLADNRLRGTIPALPSGCKLSQLDLSENGPPLGLSAGFMGALPAFDVAANLTYINVQSNALTGTIPALPHQIQVFRAAYNNLTGRLPESLAESRYLRVLDLSHNTLTGTISQSIATSSLLTVLRLADNQLGGVVPSGTWGTYLVDVDLSENGLNGQELADLLNSTSLIKLNLAANNFSFDIRAFSSKVPFNNSMLYFNISRNNVFGNLSRNVVADQIVRMQLFQKVLQADLEDDEFLQGTLPPKPLFDVSYNQLNTTFPLQLMPQLAYLSWEYTDSGSPISFEIQPQKLPNAIYCPDSRIEFPIDEMYPELEGLYNLTCWAQDGRQINITAFPNVMTQSAPARSPRPPRSPQRSPPRLPRRPPIPGAQPARDPPTATEATGGSRPPPPQALPGSTGEGAVSRGSGGGSAGDVDSSILNTSPSMGGVGAAAGSASSNGGGSGGGGGGSAGAIAGGVAVGVVVMVVLVVVGVYFYRRNRNRRSAHASKRMPLTFNSAYEAPSEGTASNYGDMQMFEFKPTDRPPRHRARMS